MARYCRLTRFRLEAWGIGVTRRSLATVLTRLDQNTKKPAKYFSAGAILQTKISANHG